VISLRRAFPADVRHRLDQAIAAAERLGLALWIVGGSVRDLAAGLPLRDLDLATNGPTSRLVARLAAALDARAHEEPRFGTASLIGADPTGATWTLDIARLRTERYVRTGALPTVTLGATIEADLARRDFSVNAMALPLTRAAASQGTRRGLVDPYGDLEDLAARRLRILNPASFRDDATRLWRAARFAARLRLRPDRATARAIASAVDSDVHYLEAISPRRLWRELALVAAEPRAAAATSLLDRWGILAATHPALALNERSRVALRRLRGATTPELLLAVLLATRAPDERAAALARLGAPRPASRSVEDAAKLLALPVATDPDTLQQASASVSAAREALRLLDPSRRAQLVALTRWERSKSPLTADELRTLGVQGGTPMGEALAELRRARYLGTLNGWPAARRLVRTWDANVVREDPSPHDQ